MPYSGMCVGQDHIQCCPLHIFSRGFAERLVASWGCCTLSSLHFTNQSTLSKCSYAVPVMSQGPSYLMTSPVTSPLSPLEGWCVPVLRMGMDQLTNQNLGWTCVCELIFGIGAFPKHLLDFFLVWLFGGSHLNVTAKCCGVCTSVLLPPFPKWSPVPTFPWQQLTTARRKEELNSPNWFSLGRAFLAWFGV